MNKKITTFLFLISMFWYVVAITQPLNIEIKYKDPNSNEIGPEKVSNKKHTLNLSEKFTDLKEFELKCDDLPVDHTLEITAVGDPPKIYKGIAVNEYQTFSFSKDLITNIITIVHKDNNSQPVLNGFDFKFEKKKENIGDDQTIINGIAINIGLKMNEEIKKYSRGLKRTRHGLVGRNENEEDIIHVFFDQYGNSLLGTIPQGIADAQYMVHVLYPINTKGKEYISYSINKTTGEFTDGLVIYNSGIKNSNGETHASFEKDYNAIQHRTFELATSTTDLTFELIRTSEDENGEIIKKVLGTYTIKMSKVYHVSMDVGLLKTNLSNPTYNLVDMPDATYKVVKETDNSPKGVVTIMASFYVSPWVLSKKYLFGKNVPKYKLWGRSFLDDHEWWERMYPAVGVGISDRSFENLFAGINWEIARGLCVFYGWHWGKVHTFTMTNYIASETPVTEKQFEFYQNNAWKRSSAFGLKLDILVIRNLFGSDSGF